MWKTVKLEDVCDIVSGQSPKSNYYNKEMKGTPFYQGSKDFGDRYLNEPTVWTTKISKKALPNDILISVRAPVGALNITKQEICIGRGLSAIREREKVNWDFLFYSLQISIKNIENKSGAVFDSINRKILQSLLINLPPLEEQKQIVKKLDATFAEIDKNLENLKKKKKQVESLVSRVLEEELKNAKGENVMLGDALIKTKIKYKVPRKKYLASGEFPIVSQDASTISGFHNNPENIFRVNKPVIVFGDHTRVLKYIDFDFVIGADGVKILLPVDEIDSKFLYYFLTLSLPKDKGYARHYKFLKEIFILVPPLEEQKKIVKKLDAINLEKDISISALNTEIDNYIALKSSILSRELEGKMAV